MKTASKLPIKIKNTYRFIEFQQSKNWLGRDKNKEEERKLIKEKIESYFEDSEFPLLFHELYDFFCSRLCDIFIEESKKNSCVDSLKDILDEILPYFEIFFPKIRLDIK